MPFTEYVEQLYDESERRGNVGWCPRCEDDAFSAEEDDPPDYEKVLCYICGVCFKYHHDDNSCEPIDDIPDLP